MLMESDSSIETSAIKASAVLLAALRSGLVRMDLNFSTIKVGLLVFEAEAQDRDRVARHFGLEEAERSWVDCAGCQSRHGQSDYQGEETRRLGEMHFACYLNRAGRGRECLCLLLKIRTEGRALRAKVPSIYHQQQVNYSTSHLMF